MSYDITFCSYKKCKNKDCERHQDRLKNYSYAVSMSDFKNCKYWKDEFLKDILDELRM